MNTKSKLPVHSYVTLAIALFLSVIKLVFHLKFSWLVPIFIVFAPPILAICFIGYKRLFPIIAILCLFSACQKEPQPSPTYLITWESVSSQFPYQQTESYLTINSRRIYKKNYESVSANRGDTAKIILTTTVPAKSKILVNGIEVWNEKSPTDYYIVK